jgi:serine/threonine protein kinase
VSDPARPYKFSDEPIARGSQGTVWLARDATGQRVAVKIAGASSQSQASLRREIRLMRALNEAGVEGVVQVLDDLEIDDRPAMVMPFYEQHLGMWLDDVVRNPTAGTLADILRMCALLAFALGDIHRTWIDDGTVVHRDVKPENIFLDAHGDPLLGDFGGAMAIDGLKAVELALFGTPMWAPLDQILAGNTIPDPTWDTYALCVLVYAALTGERPQYQADPSVLLTDRGKELWHAARQAIRAPAGERRKWHAHFARARVGTRPDHLVDLTGHAALSQVDRRAIETGVHRLAQLSRLDARTEASIARGVWTLLVRGLSPLGHPSPPNRYREAEELGEVLQRLHAQVGRARGGASGLTELVAPDGALSDETTEEIRRPPRTTLRAGLSLVTLGIGSVLIFGLAALVWLGRGPLIELYASLAPLPDRVRAGDVWLDTTEVTTGSWRRCAEAGDCAAVPDGPDELPAVGLSIEDARALCAFRGGRVPTHAEWSAATGDGPYPWGDAPPTCRRAHGLDCGDGARSVGQTRAGAGPTGAVDLSGNAWEWVEGPAGPLLVGGGATSAGEDLRTDAARPPPASGRHPLAGARCAYP